MTLWKTITLCANCVYRRDIQTAKGSRFLLCELSQSDGRFAKYPPQPVTGCRGFEEKK